MDRIGKLSITLFDPLVVVSLVYLCLINEKTIFSVFTVLNYSHKNTLNMPNVFVDKRLLRFYIDLLEMFMKFDLLPLKKFGVPLTKTDFLFVPVINSKFVFFKL